MATNTLATNTAPGSAVASSISWGSLATLRQILDLLAALRSPNEPLTTASGLRNAVAKVLQIAVAVGVDSAWTARVSQILDDPAVFNIALALVQYLVGLGGVEHPDGTLQVMNAVTGQTIRVDAQSLIDWLPLIVQLLSLLRQIQGANV